jgi:pilus assembly protein CpaE
MPECKVLLVEDNLGDARSLQEMLADADSGLFRVQIVDSLVAALNALALRRFDVALVDLSLASSHGLETLLTVQRHAPGLPIVALTGQDSESMAMAAVERGAQDCLVKGTLRVESLVRSLQYAMLRRNRSTAPVEAQVATVIGILGAKGGVGTTTIACHWALELRRQTKKKVLLLDLDVSSASASFLMEVHSEYTTAEASTNLHRLDASYWNSLVCTTPHGIDVLQAPGAMRFHDPLNGERVRHVLRFARTLYGYVVVDLGRLNDLSLSLAAELSEMFVVTTPEIPALYETGRVLVKLAEPGVMGGRTQLILNRLGKGISHSLSDLECVLGRPVCATIGDYSSELHDAYGMGQFLDEHLTISKQSRQMVATYLGGGAAEPKSSSRGALGLLRLAGVRD